MEVYRGIFSILRGEQLPPSPSPPHISPRVITSILTIHHGRQTPQPSPCAEHSCLFSPIRRSSPYTCRVVASSISLRSLLARDNDDSSDVHRCSCHRVAVMLVVMMVVMLFVCHPETSLLTPPLLPLPNHQHAVATAIAAATSIATAVAIAFAAAITTTLASLSLSPPSSTQRSSAGIEYANSLNAAIAGCRHHRGHHRCCCRHCCTHCNHH